MSAFAAFQLAVVAHRFLPAIDIDLYVSAHSALTHRIPPTNMQHLASLTFFVCKRKQSRQLDFPAL